MAAAEPTNELKEICDFLVKNIPASKDSSESSMKQQQLQKALDTIREIAEKHSNTQKKEKIDVLGLRRQRIEQECHLTKLKNAVSCLKEAGQIEQTIVDKAEELFFELLKLCVTRDESQNKDELQNIWVYVIALKNAKDIASKHPNVNEQPTIFKTALLEGNIKIDRIQQMTQRLRRIKHSFLAKELERTLEELHTEIQPWIEQLENAPIDKEGEYEDVFRMSSTFLASVIPSRDHVDGRNSHKKRKHKREVDALSGSESERETDDQSDRQDPSITLGDDGRSPKEVRKSAIVLSYTTPPSSHTSLPSSHVPVVI